MCRALDVVVMKGKPPVPVDGPSDIKSLLIPPSAPRRNLATRADEYQLWKFLDFMRGGVVDRDRAMQVFCEIYECNVIQAFMGIEPMIGVFIKDLGDEAWAFELTAKGRAALAITDKEFAG